jgi:hypothetical protein
VDAHLVEEQLGLVEPALAHLVERLAPGDAPQVERHDRHAAARHALTRVERDEGERVGRDRSIRDPDRLLTAQHVVLAVTARDQATRDARVVELRRADHERIRAMFRLADRPAADEARVVVLGERAYELRDQLRIAGLRRDHERESSDRDAEREVGAAPAELLEHDVLPETVQAEPTYLRRQQCPVAAETVGLVERPPERRALGDHVGGIGKPVERRRRRAEELLREGVDAFPRAACSG